jgi:hypothetical protein
VPFFFLVCFLGSCGGAGAWVFLGLRSAPHSGQNFDVTGMCVWHLGQMSTTGLYEGV